MNYRWIKTKNTYTIIKKQKQLNWFKNIIVKSQTKSQRSLSETRSWTLHMTPLKQI